VEPLTQMDRIPKLTVAKPATTALMVAETQDRKVTEVKERVDIVQKVKMNRN